LPKDFVALTSETETARLSRAVSVFAPRSLLPGENRRRLFHAIAGMTANGCISPGPSKLTTLPLLGFLG
jgi:hypothetical protein